MSILRVKPEGDNRGKNKIYFCCHKDDFKGYFDLISDEILKYAGNSAIYYCENGDNEDFSEEHREDIKTMQLFVVPVTSRLVGSENTAMDKEIPFAIKEGIPVLPLLQEDIIESYTKKFGDLQFLYKYDKDDTAIPYEEKLQKYLTSLLIDDETAGRVRAAFDAYIFLSYRKKDRKFANALMKLIHSCDELRDIAIWYDEFLIPGEYFPETIEAALKKSKLFTMLVTPNLTDETNYVISTEYPMAKRENKTILPAEAVKTDREKLKNCCRKSLEEDNFRAEDITSDEIDNTVSAENRELLFKNIAPLAKADNDRDPEHNYLIGLAYLRGIDVETNREKGAELIKASAEAGNTEAIKKLVDMYNTGEGVERNYNTAVIWQEKLVEILKDRLNKTNEFSDAEELIIETSNLGNFLKGTGNADEAIKTYKNAASLCDGTYINENKDDLVFYKVQITNRLSEILIEERKILEAQKIVEDTLNILENYEEGSFKNKQTALCYNRLGDIYEAQGYLAEAYNYYMKGLGIRERINEISDTLEAKRDLSVSYNRIGDTYKAQKKLSEAYEYYMKAFRIAESIIEASDTIEAKRDLSVSYNRIGDIYKAQGKLSEALEYYIKKLRIDESIKENSDTIEAKRDLSVSYNNIGDIYKAQGDLSEAYDYYMKALRISESIFKISDTIEAKRDLAVSYNNIGDIYKTQGDFSEPLEYYIKSLILREEIFKTSDTIEAKRDLSVIYNNIGNIYRAQVKLSEALEYYMYALRISESIFEISDMLEAKRDLSVIYNNVGFIYAAQGNLSEALEYYTKCLRILENIIEISDTLEAKRDLSTSYNDIGDIYKAQKKLSEALEYYMKAFRIAESIIEASDTLEAKRDLSTSYNKIGDIYKAQGNLSEAFDYYMKGLRIRESIIKTCDTVESKILLIFSYYGLGDLFIRKKDFSQAEEYLLKAAALTEKIYEKNPSEVFRNILRVLYDMLRKVYKELGDKEKEEMYCEKKKKL